MLLTIQRTNQRLRSKRVSIVIRSSTSMLKWNEKFITERVDVIVFIGVVERFTGVRRKKEHWLSSRSWKEEQEKCQTPNRVSQA